MGWATKYARKNYWRVANYLEFEDLIADARLAFYYVLEHYPGAKEEKHIMALFKRVYYCRIEDRAKRHIEEQAITDRDYEHLHFRELHQKVAEGPPELRIVVEKLQDPKVLKQLTNPIYRRQLGRRRETRRDRLQRVLGVIDIDTAVQTGKATAEQILIWAFSKSGLYDYPVTIESALLSYLS